MVTQATHRNDTVFGAVADPTRREILDILSRCERSAGELAQRFPISRPAVSRHLRVLRNAGLVTESRRAQSRVYALNPEPLAEVEEWVNKYRVFWGARLHSLKQFVEGELK